MISPTFRRPSPGSRCGRHRSAGLSIAAERQGGYDPAAGQHGSGQGADRRAGDATGAEDDVGPAALADDVESADDTGAPLGLPVLAELPELASVLARVREADRCLVDAVLTLRRLLADGSVEATTGVGIEHWLAATARMAGIDRRMLRRMCRLLERLPALADGAADGKVSFTQLRALTLELSGASRAPLAVDVRLDEWLAATIEELPDDTDPDVLVKQAARAADELAPEVLDLEAADVSRYQRGLVIQPFLDGTGGTFQGVEDAAGLALLDAATAPQRAQLDNVARARADNLRARLVAGHTRPSLPSTASTADTDGTGDADGTSAGGADLAEYVAHLGDEVDVAALIEALPVPQMLLRWEFDGLSNARRVPAEILTRLVGGRLRLTSEYARRLIEARGAEVRTVIVDDGEVVGVGRASRVPPGWLREATLAIHETCTEPLCDRPALGADTDHATPWSPQGDGRPAGHTDLDNLGPLCARTNRDKRASGWTSHQTPRAGRTWRHERTGLSITTLPGTWRPTGIPKPARPDPNSHRAPPSHTDGPHHHHDPADTDGPITDGGDGPTAPVDDGEDDLPF